ncbi:twin-arginine translocation signal domain-containing protein [Parabacteroides distasonis]
MERRNFIKSSLGIGLGATLPGMTQPIRISCPNYARRWQNTCPSEETHS